MYVYEEMKPVILKPEKVIDILQTYKKIMALCEGNHAPVSSMDLLSGDSWEALARLDYLVEIGFLREVNIVPKPVGQERLFYLEQ